MSDTTFTPGPWKVVTHYGKDRLINDETGKSFSVVLPDPGSFPEDIICEVWGQEHDDAANASLIAAAPELLECCKLALNAFERNDAINWDDLRRAIEKAEGK